jgi:CRISPR-associated endonuclease/helicase Cas3
MIHLTISAGSQALARAVEQPPDWTGPPLLGHQAETWRAGQSTRLIVNSFPTGTGKTLAALLPLRDRHYEHNCLLIAPTNELLAQHARDAEGFVARWGLPHLVRAMTAAEIDHLEDLPGISAHRRADRLSQFLQDPAGALGLPSRRPLLLVMNPDLFYLGLYLQFNRQDRRNVFRALTSFRYLIVDEFHYYNAKQFANFLFFLGFLRSFGYFEDQPHARQEVCLLSATPHSRLRAYLDRLAVPWVEIGPGLIPAGAPLVPTTAPLDLRLVSLADTPGLEALVKGALPEIGRRLQRGEHGAIISGALWRVNQVFDRLRRAGLAQHAARLTGAEAATARAAARSADLLLATPTVDIGYNFDRPTKPRQSIDFLFCDARFGDELLQRVGRAGRVLGKSIVDQPSVVWAVVPPGIYDAFRELDKQTLSREHFAARAAALPHRHNLYAYLRSGAVGEAFRPIYELQRMVAPEEQNDVRQLFEEVRALFGAGSRLTFDRLAVRTRYYLFLEESLRGMRWPTDTAVAQSASRFVEQSERDRQQAYTPAERERLVTLASEPGNAIFEAARDWLDGQLRRRAVLGASFTFREATEAPDALIYDPQHLLASADQCRYDVLHVVANYEARFFPNRRAWEIGNSVRASDSDEALFYCTLLARRAPDQRLRLGLTLTIDDDLDQWEDRHCGRLIALGSVGLVAQGQPLPTGLVDVWREYYLIILALRRDTRAAGVLLRLASENGLIPQNLSVISLRDSRRREYVGVLGTAALLLEPELRRAIFLGQRLAAAGGPPIVI